MATSAFNPWFRLFRLPNLLTVPGDPLAGFLLAAGPFDSPHVLPLLAATGTSLCLYLFGLAINDLVDLEVDRIERPERPLPAGELTRPQVRMAAIALALSGLNLALAAGRSVLFLASVLAGLILAYNASLKHRPWPGALSMGLCRGLSLFIGVAAARPDLFSRAPDTVLLPPLFAVAGLTCFVAGLTAIARTEMTDEKSATALRWLPFCALLIALPAVLFASLPLKRIDGILPTISIFLMVMTLMKTWLLGGPLFRLQPRPATIAGHIRNLLLIQACFCMATGVAGLFPCLFLVLLFFVFPRGSARYYSS